MHHSCQVTIEHSFSAKSFFSDEDVYLFTKRIKRLAGASTNTAARRGVACKCDLELEDGCTPEPQPSRSASPPRPAIRSSPSPNAVSLSSEIVGDRTRPH